MMQKILLDSWGYDMTINDYALVIEETPKTIKCVLVGCKVTDDNGLGGGKSMPDSAKIISEPFTLRASKQGGGYNGTYPFCSGGKRFGRFNEWNGRANYYNTWD